MPAVVQRRQTFGLPIAEGFASFLFRHLATRQFIQQSLFRYKVASSPRLVRREKGARITPTGLRPVGDPGTPLCSN